jgi:VCBS repeat-containing protein
MEFQMDIWLTMRPLPGFARLARFWDNLFLACENRLALLGSRLRRSLRRPPATPHAARAALALESLEPRWLPNNAPVAVADAYSVLHDHQLSVSSASQGVLANDTDADHDPLSVVGYSYPQHGYFTLDADGTFLYEPDADYVGSDSFTYTVSDGTDTDQATVSLTVTNHAPVATLESYSVLHDQQLTVSSAAQGVLANDTDADGDPLSIVAHSDPLHGYFTMQSDGTFIYEPDPGYSGTDAFNYTVSDGAATDEVTVTLYVAGKGPVTVQATSPNASERGPVPGRFTLTRGGDLSSSLTVSYTLGGTATNGTDYASLSGSVTFAANQNTAVVTVTPITDNSAEGTETVVLTLSAGGSTYLVGTPSSATVSIRDNATPVAHADSYSLPHDRTFTAGSVLANDTDADVIDTLTATLGTGPSHGTLTLHADGSFVYAPNAGYTGSDSFTYTASDGLATSGSATVSLTVTDAAPVAGDDSYGVQAGLTRTVSASQGVLRNDTDSDGETLTVSLVSGQGPSHGTLTLNADGSFSYTPAGGYSGSDSFTYAVSDGALSDTAVVSLNVHATNSAPSAGADSYSVLHDQVLTVPFAQGALGNETDGDGDPLTVSLVSGHGPTHGTLMLNADGSFVYSPAVGYTGSDSFQYVANDGLADSAAATVSITVTDPHTPIAAADSYTLGRNKTSSITLDVGVLANDTDTDDEPLTAALVSGQGPSHGTLTLNADGSFDYTPTAGYLGTDSFQYTASDGALTSSAATATITVVNSAPQAVSHAYSVLHDTTLAVPAVGLLLYASDPEGDTITAAVGTGPAHGSVTVNGNGSFSYVPVASYVGTDSFTYTVSDGSLTSDAATVTLTVKASNTAPTATADTYTVAHDSVRRTGVDDGVLANDSDADSDPLLAVLVSGPTHGTLALSIDGSFVYTPTAGYTGSDSFTYHAFDGTTTSTTVTVSLTVADDVPTAQAVTYSVLSSGTTNVDAYRGVLAYDSDGEDSLTAVWYSGPSHGTLTLNSDGSFSYTPGGGFTGSDAFSYRAYDGTNYSSAVTVGLTTAPVAWADSYSLSHDQTLTVSAAGGVLANDDLATGDPLTATQVSGPTHGTLSLSSDGSFSYTPTAGFVGSDSFSYYATGDSLNSATVTVTLSVENEAPVGYGMAFAVSENEILLVSSRRGVLAYEYDPDGDTASATLDSGPSHGTLVLRGDGAFIYTPDPNFAGSDSFTYHPTDGLASGDPVTITIQVNQTVTFGTDLRAVAAADVDGDGKTDVIVADASTGKVSVFLGNGDGTTAITAVSPQTQVGSEPTALVVADFDDDGTPDLAVANKGSNTVSILLGDGDGTFTPDSTVSVGTAPRSLAVGDFNGDGEDDLAVANGGSATISIRLGNGDGTFTSAATITLSSSPGAVAVGDVTGDGTPDVVVSRPSANSISVFAGNGDGTFQPPVSYAVGSQPTALLVADLNADGVGDVAVANTAGNSVSVLLATGEGMLAPAVQYATGAAPVALVAADLAGYGYLDLAVANSTGNSITYLKNRGDSTFQDPVGSLMMNVTTEGSPVALAVADFKGNGQREIVAAQACEAQYFDPMCFVTAATSPVTVKQVADIAAIKEKFIKDCWFIAAVVGLAKHRPDEIVKMITDNGDGTYDVKFPKKRAVNVRVDNQAQFTGKLSESNGNWAAMLVEAAAHFVDLDSWAVCFGKGTKLLTGHGESMSTNGSNGGFGNPINSFEDKIGDAYFRKTSKIILFSTSAVWTPSIGKRLEGLDGGHVYVVVKITGTIEGGVRKLLKIYLRDPRGPQGIPENRAGDDFVFWMYPSEANEQSNFIGLSIEDDS